MSEELSLKIERIFNAPIQKVWDAWTQPDLLKLWSCPTDFEVTEITGEVRVGGIWRETMVSEKLGYSGKLRGEYMLIEEPNKLVSSHIWLKDDGSDDTYSEYTIELSEQNGKTHMTFTQVGFVSVESRDSHQSGWSSTFIKLTELVEEK